MKIHLICNLNYSYKKVGTFHNAFIDLLFKKGGNLGNENKE